MPRPSEAAAGKEFAQGGDHPSPPSLTPHFARLRRTVSAVQSPLQLSSPPQAPETTTFATLFDMTSMSSSRAQSATPKTVSASRPASPAFSFRATRASCRLRQLRCWVAPSPEVSSPASGPAHFLRSRSAGSLRLGHTRPLFLHTSVGVNPARSVPGSREAAVPAAGADSVGTSPPQTAPVSLCLAAYAAVNVVPLFGQVSRPGSVRGGRLSTLRVRSPPLHCSALKGSAVFRSRAQPPPRRQTASPDTLHFVPRPMALPDS